MLLLLTESHIKTDKVCVTNEFVSFVFRKRHKRRYHILIYIEKKKQSRFWNKKDEVSLSL